MTFLRCTLSFFLMAQMLLRGIKKGKPCATQLMRCRVMNAADTKIQIPDDSFVMLDASESQ